MNKIYPYFENKVIDSIIPGACCDFAMTDKIISNHDQSTFPEEIVNALVDTNISHENISIPINKELNIKEGNSHQVSAFVKFIKSSFSSNKKKPGAVVGSNQKSIISLRNNSQINIQNEIIISEDTVPSFIPSVNSSSDISCRFCQEYEPDNELVTPCLCSGTMKYIHQSCLQRWIKTQDNRFCELCKYEFHMKITTKPFKEWQRLEMSVVERRKIICSVTFHVIALTCVIWSLYVLIERTTEEMRDGRLDWPFWTKLIVVAIGFIGGIIFMYVQCRMYITLCRKWHSFNRTFVVQSISSNERNIAQINAKLKSEIYPKNVHGLTNVYGDVSSDRNIVNNLNNDMAPIATSSNEDLNYSFSTMSRTSINDSGVSEGLNLNVGILNVDGNQFIQKHVI